MNTRNAVPRSGQTQGILHLRIPPDPRYARTVRDAILGFGTLHGIAEADIEALLFAVGEALANAIEHASTYSDIEVIASADDESVRATITDHGRGFERKPSTEVPLPNALTERGRGIPIMQRCTDFFDVRSIPGKGTSVTLGRYRRGTREMERSAVS